MEPEEQRLVPLLKRIDEGSLYVPAAAGAGKSTFCRWAALQSIPGHPDLPSGPGAGGVPGAGAGSAARPACRCWSRCGISGTDDGLRPRAPHLASERSGAGARRLGRPVAATGPERRPAQGPPGGGQRLPVAGWPGRGARSRNPANGATVYPRELLLSGLADALPAWEAAGNRTLLTSRPYGLDEAGLARLGLPRAPLEPLPRPLAGSVRQPLVPHARAGRSWQAA